MSPYIILMRHAQAAFEDANGVSIPDHARPLTWAGEQQCVAQRQRLLAMDLCPDLIVHSSSRRTTQTAEQVAPSPQIPRLAEAKLYNGQQDVGADGYWRLAIRHYQTAQPQQGMMLIGHNPSISVLASKLLADAEDLAVAGSVQGSFQGSFSPADMLLILLPLDAKLAQPDASWRFSFLPSKDGLTHP
jgi:phosphohistidine phosphatase